MVLPQASKQGLITALLFGFASASPTLISGLGLDTLLGNIEAQITTSVGPYGLDNAQCSTQTYEVNADSTNTKFVGIDQTQQNQSSVTSLLLEIATSPSSFENTYTDGTFSYTGSFSISGTLCTPKQGAKTDSAIQLLVHGVGFDSSYWDFAYAPEYSYVKTAASYGYTTFRFDRLGCGKSETPANGFETAQAPTEISILTNILKMLRETSKIGGQQWKRVVGIGHSLGSVETQAVSASNPSLYDGLILQGFSTNGSFMNSFLLSGSYSIASQTLPAELSNKPSTWLVTGSEASLQQGFFFYPNYAQGAFNLTRQTEQPVTVGTLFTVGSSVTPAPDFTNPVMVVTGEKDIPFAAGDANAGQNGLSKAQQVQPDLYPNVPADKFVTYIPKNTGHAVNQHFSAPEAYAQMLNFIAANNL